MAFYLFLTGLLSVLWLCENTILNDLRFDFHRHFENQISNQIPIFQYDLKISKSSQNDLKSDFVKSSIKSLNTLPVPVGGIGMNEVKGGWGELFVRGTRIKKFSQKSMQRIIIYLLSRHCKR
jgi:hypothetical protein